MTPQPSSALLASIGRMRARTWHDKAAADYEAGGGPTLPAKTTAVCPQKVTATITPSLRRRAAPHTYDPEKSYRRRKHLAFSGPMPPHLAGLLTLGAVAVMRIVADECRKQGRCSRSMAEIAARAGVCRKTAQRAIERASTASLIVVRASRRRGPRQAPNTVRIISVEWLAWLRMSEGHSGRTTNNTTDNDCKGAVDRNSALAARCQSQTRAHYDRRKQAISKQAATSVPPSPEAGRLAEEVADVGRAHIRPASWVQTEPARHVARWLQELSSIADIVHPRRPADVLLLIVRTVLSRIPNGTPVYSPRYFEPEIRKFVREMQRMRVPPSSVHTKLAARSINRGPPLRGPTEGKARPRDISQFCNRAGDSVSQTMRRSNIET
jgi:hypothetical protein